MVVKIKINVDHPMITSKSVAWGERNKELYKASQEAIRYSVQNHLQKKGSMTGLKTGHH